MSARFSKTRSGEYKVKLHAAERGLLRSLREQYRDLLLDGDAEDPAMARLFPPASLDDEEVVAEMGALVRADLTTQRLDALERMEVTADAMRLTEEDMEAWLAVANDLRLILGTRLEITEESEEQDFTGDAGRSYGVYRFLTAVVSQLVAALSGITEAALAPDFYRRGDAQP